MLKGVDLSAIQGKIDGAKIKADFAFAYHRCGVGNELAYDSCFDSNMSALRSAGVKVGAYHFVYPLPDAPGHDDRDPIRQARQHYAMSRGVRSGDLRPAVDIEWPTAQEWGKWQCSAGQIKAWCRAYLAECERLYGVKPLVYTYPDFAAHVSFGLDMADFPLWLASYQPEPAIVPPWGKSWTVWQTGQGKLYDGRPVDLDVMSEASLALLTVG